MVFYKNKPQHLLDKYTVKYFIQLKKKNSSLGKMRNVSVYKNRLPLSIRIKQLCFSKKNQAGVNNQGSRIIRTRGRSIKRKQYFKVNYMYRYTCIGFIASFIFVPFRNKVLSLLFLSSGSITYVPTTYEHKLFFLCKLFSTRDSYLRKLLKHSIYHLDFAKLKIHTSFFIVHQLPKNSPVSFLELYPLKGMQYSRSAGTDSKIIRMDSRLDTGLLKLPSGVKKVFSIFGLGSKGTAALSDNQKFTNNKAGYRKSYGKKSIVRGVAMNPIDHPHGGRTKAIKYPRTP